jgi:segregation and condensation protein B|tara:strand:- start:201 stop:725 length:525 start_codon:yes stop_codon:yes gene_type:complete
MDEKQAKNLIEALIFSAEEPLSIESIRKILSTYGKFDLEKLINDLENDYKNRGINLQSIEKKNFFFKTSEDLGVFLNIQTEKTRNLSQAAMETLAIISYHQPVTRAEIEKIRGKPVFRGTLDNLLELKWIKPAGRRETPGRPVTWVTDIEFLKHFGLSSIKDLPKVDELESIIM